MIWKPKPEELTHDQAVSLAKKELAPFWFGSKPLLAGVKIGNETSAYPLDPIFNEHNWLILFINPTHSRGEEALKYAQEWHRRYHDMGLGIFIIFKPPYTFFKKADTITQWIQWNRIEFPVVLDADGLLSVAFAANELPRLTLVKKGHVIKECVGLADFEDFESEIQSLLRQEDPGLALSSVFRLGRSPLHQTFTVEFGRGQDTLFSKPGFSASASNPDDEVWSTEFREKWPSDLLSQPIYLFGKWTQDRERIVALDPSAELGFKLPSSGLSVVAQSLSKTSEPAKLIITVGGGPVFDSFNGGDLAFDDDGQSYVRVELGQLYRVLRNIPEENREVVLKFPIAHRVPIALYGFRFV